MRHHLWISLLHIYIVLTILIRGLSASKKRSKLCNCNNVSESMQSLISLMGYIDGATSSKNQTIPFLAGANDTNATIHEDEILLQESLKIVSAIYGEAHTGDEDAFQDTLTAYTSMDLIDDAATCCALVAAHRAHAQNMSSLSLVQPLSVLGAILFAKGMYDDAELFETAVLEIINQRMEEILGPSKVQKLVENLGFPPAEVSFMPLEQPADIESMVNELLSLQRKKASILSKLAATFRMEGKLGLRTEEMLLGSLEIFWETAIQNSRHPDKKTGKNSDNSSSQQLFWARDHCKALQPHSFCSAANTFQGNSSQCVGLKTSKVREADISSTNNSFGAFLDSYLRLDDDQLAGATEDVLCACRDRSAGTSWTRIRGLKSIHSVNSNSSALFTACSYRTKVIPIDRNVATALCNLGVFYMHKGQYSSAMVLGRSSLKTRLGLVGNVYHLDVALSLEMLAEISTRLGHIAESDMLRGVAVHIIKVLLGCDSPVYQRFCP